MADGLADEPGNAEILALAGALCAKLCHDLAGTLGALGGLLDMVAEAPDPDALALARDCARDLSARLCLLRAAWGVDAEMPALASLVPGLPNADKLTVRLDGLALDADGPAAQLAASLLLVAAGGLPRGGTIQLAGAARRYTLAIAGARAAWPAGLFGKPEPATPRNVAVCMARHQAQALGLRMSLLSDGELLVGSA